MMIDAKYYFLRSHCSPMVVVLADGVAIGMSSQCGHSEEESRVFHNDELVEGLEESIIRLKDYLCVWIST